MSKTTEGNKYCCIFCKCVEDIRHRFKNKVLINRIHKCKFVDMYGRSKIKQIEAYNKYMEKHRYDIDFKNKRNQSKRESYHKCKNNNKLHQEAV